MKMDEEVKRVLYALREKVESSADAIYADRSEALSDIDALLISPSKSGFKALLAPTANLQELSIENGWGDVFNEFAAQLESL